VRGAHIARPCSTPASMWVTGDVFPCITPLCARTMSPANARGFWSTALVSARGLDGNARGDGRIRTGRRRHRTLTHTHTSEHLADALMPHAHAEEGVLGAQLTHSLQRDPRVLRSACDGRQGADSAGMRMCACAHALPGWPLLPSRENPESAHGQLRHLREGRSWPGRWGKQAGDAPGPGDTKIPDGFNLRAIPTSPGEPGRCSCPRAKAPLPDVEVSQPTARVRASLSHEHTTPRLTTNPPWCTRRGPRTGESPPP